MILRDFQIEPLQLRLRQPLTTARGTWRVRAGAVFSLFGAEGLGMGEATPLEFAPSFAERAFEALALAGNALVGREEPDSVEAIEGILATLPALETEPAARHAVESALLDLLAQRRGVPVAALLTPRPRASIEVNALLSATSPEALAEQGRAAAAEGFSVFKVKVGALPLEEDDARLDALRAALGASARIRIDANGAWEAGMAKSALRFLCRHRIELCEQPVTTGGVDALVALRGTVPCRIAADEAAFGMDAARGVLAADAVDVLVLRPMVLGGLLPTLMIAGEAAARGVGSYVASSLDGVVARAASVHAAAALPSADWACGLGVGSLFEALEEGALAPEQGRIEVPTRPGLGVDADGRFS